MLSKFSRTICFSFALLGLGASTIFAQPTPAKIEKPSESEAKPAEAEKRSDVNMLGKTEAASGESRRNENVQFNLIDNNALKESNLRLGTSATIISEFAVDKNYFGAEFGTAPKALLTLPTTLRSGTHGTLRYTHQNSVFSARAFFQVGSVKPARENDYGLNFGTQLGQKTKFFFDGGQTKIRGVVNGNVLVPKADERTPLATDPATRVIVARLLAAYRNELPNRTDINPRALNTNSPQIINNQQASVRLDRTLPKLGNLLLQYNYTNQNVQAFQLIAGQNPNTDTKSHLARIAWAQQWNAKTALNFAATYDRATTVLQPEKNAVGPFVLTSGLTNLGPDGTIPTNRAQNQIRYAGQLRRVAGNHIATVGFSTLRRQLNGYESDAHRGVFSFGNDFGRTTIENLRWGTATQFLASVGNIYRGFRLWDLQFYAGDNWKINQRLSLQYGLNYQAATTPIEVNHLNKIPYNCDCNNFAPALGIAYRMPQNLGVLRTGAAVHFGEIFTPTFQQVRFSPPLNNKVVISNPYLPNPFLNAPTSQVKPTLYELDPALAAPYSYQYTLSWEPALGKNFTKYAKLQIGYVGSRSHKLLVMWYLNRAHPVPGIPLTTATVNLRRPNPNYADVRLIVNGSQGYYDAGRVSLALNNWHGVTMDAAYWFSKAIDLGSSYTSTAYDQDSRLSRSQYEFETQRDMKGPSTFDQPHAFLWRINYLTPKLSGGAEQWANKILSGWNFSLIALVKSGTAFNIVSGSDAPNFGNVDGNQSDRPNIIDPSILGRTIGHPDTATQLLPRSAFAFFKCNDTSCAETRGNVGRNAFRRGGIRNVNATITRAWSALKDVRVTFKTEAINLFNTPQFAEPGFELANPNFGQITNTLNDGRTFRFGLQIGW